MNFFSMCHRLLLLFWQFFVFLDLFSDPIQRDNTTIPPHDAIYEIRLRKIHRIVNDIKICYRKLCYIIIVMFESTRKKEERIH